MGMYYDYTPHQTPMLQPMMTPRQDAMQHPPSTPNYGANAGPMSPNSYSQMPNTGVQTPGGQTPMPPNCLMSVKPADQMTSEEAARWIGSIGRLKGWVEADTYEQNCMRHEISGFMLSQLTME